MNPGGRGFGKVSVRPAWQSGEEQMKRGKRAGVTQHRQQQAEQQQAKKTSAGHKSVDAYLAAASASAMSWAWS